MDTVSRGCIAGEPTIKTHHDPVGLIGKGNLQRFTEHYKVCHSRAYSGEYLDKKLNEAFGVDGRAAISAAYDRLRNSGFYPNGINHKGEIRWSVSLKSESHKIRDDGLSELEKLSKEELMDMARNGFRGIMAKRKVEKPTSTQADFENVLTGGKLDVPERFGG